VGGGTKEKEMSEYNGGQVGLNINIAKRVSQLHCWRDEAGEKRDDLGIPNAKVTAAKKLLLYETTERRTSGKLRIDTEPPLESVSALLLKEYLEATKPCQEKRIPEGGAPNWGLLASGACRSSGQTSYQRK